MKNNSRILNPEPAAASRLMSGLRRLWMQAQASWWLVLAAVVVALGATAGVYAFGSARWASSGRMIVNVKLSLPEGSLYTEELSNFLGTQAALMQSKVVLSRAHERSRPHASKAITTEMAPDVQLKVAVLPRTTIFEIEATSNDPAYARSFAQACMQEYIELKRDMRSQTSDSTLAGLSEQIAKLERDLIEAQGRLLEFQVTTAGLATPQQENAEAQSLAALRSRLYALELEETSIATPAIAPEAGSQNPDATVHRAEFLKCSQELVLLKAKDQELAQDLRPAHPKRQALARQIHNAERLLSLYREQTAEQATDRGRWLTNMIDLTRKQLQEREAKDVAAQRKGAEQQRLKASVQHLQTLHDRLLATLQTVDVNKDINPETVSILQPATEPLRVDTGLWLRLIIAVGVGLSMGLGGLWILDTLEDRMHQVEEVESVLCEPVLAQIPVQKPTRQGQIPLLSGNDPRHPFVEACRNLRSGLLFMPQGNERPQAIVVTSSVPNEGKSLTVANLGIVLAQAGSEILLVDGDLRKGSLHRLFGLECSPEVGFSKVLTAAVPWQTAMQSTSQPRLSVIPRGPVSDLSPDLFLSEAFSRFLADARARFAMILIDAPPVFAADDATSLAPLTDGFLFVIRAHSTSARVARTALEVLRDRQAKCLGAILNAVRPNRLDGTAYANYAYYGVRRL